MVANKIKFMKNDKQQKLYECPECHLKYKDKEWAVKCEAWCKEYKSCNLDIIKHAKIGK